MFASEQNTMNIAKSVTLASIKTLNPGDVLRDPVLKGFGARRRSAAITYFVQTRINGQQRFFTIGTHGTPWTPEKARERATQILYAAKNGIDLDAYRDVDLSLTFTDVFKLFFEATEHELKASTAKEYRRIAKVTLSPFFATKPFATISHRDAADLHRKLKDRPSAANHALKLAKAVFYWAEENNLWKGDKNPCAKVKLYPTCARAQFLSVDDLKRLAHSFRWALATGAATPLQLSAILMLLFTGSRRGEVFTLQRSWVDRHRMLAHLPDSKTGSKVLHLNPQAMAVLDGIPEVEGNPHYFPGARPGKCISGVRKPWDRIRKHAKLDRFRLHDLRHSFASFAADGGATAQAVGAVLGHASIETTKIYLHLFNNRATETTVAAARRMHGIIASQAPALVPTSGQRRSLNLTFLRRRPFLPRQKPGVEVR